MEKLSQNNEKKITTHCNSHCNFKFWKIDPPYCTYSTCVLPQSRIRINVKQTMAQNFLLIRLEPLPNTSFELAENNRKKTSKSLWKTRPPSFQRGNNLLSGRFIPGNLSADWDGELLALLLELKSRNWRGTSLHTWRGSSQHFSLGTSLHTWRGSSQHFWRGSSQHFWRGSSRHFWRGSSQHRPCLSHSFSVTVVHCFSVT